MKTPLTVRYPAFCLMALLAGAPALPAAASTGPDVATPAGSAVAARLAAQNALFDEQYESDLRFSPQTATAWGDYRYNDRLDDASLAAIAAAGDADRRFLARMRAIPTTGFATQDVLSHRVFVRMLEQRIANDSFREYEMPVSQMQGPHLELADLPLSSPFQSVRHYEDYLARLRQVPRVFAQTEEVLRAGVRDRLMPVRFLLDKVPAQCDGIVAANPFLLPLQKFPASVPAEDRERLTREITAVVTRDVLPAYRQFGAFIASDYAPHGRSDLSVGSLPGGAQRYLNAIRNSTTIGDLTPDQIHAIGLREITRIEGEMLAIARQQGFPDLATFRASLQTNPKYIPASAQQILDEYRRYLAQMQPKLSQLFGFVPAIPFTVEAIPDFQAPGATHYQPGTPDGSRPGRIVVATSDFAHRSLLEDEATAYHEGIPGHHLQHAVVQQMTGLPKFRQHVHNSGYIEGWALYAEGLGKEVGFYQDPLSDYARLRNELFRAVRLVVDTGIHAKGWSRDQVVTFMLDKAVADGPKTQAETDRYIAWPAQALSYKLGQMKFRELRERARAALGERFDIRAFHDEMLAGGVLPLDLLDQHTNEWIAAQRVTPDEAAFRSLYKELIEINTTRSAGNCTQAAEAMRAHLIAAGMAERDAQVLAPPDRPRDGALVAVLHGRDRIARPILMLAHIDVVEANRADWQRDPFRLVEEGGWFYARGATDDKAMAAIFTDSLVRYLREGFRPQHDIKLALTCGEETAETFNSVKWLLATRPDALAADFALNEGASGELDREGRHVTLQIQAGEKVYQDFALDVSDPGGHSARPTRTNAILRLGAALTRLGAYRFPVSLNPTTRAYLEAEAALVPPDLAADLRAVLKDPGDEAAADRLWTQNPMWNGTLRTTCVVTQISGGHAPNALPQAAHANVNCRILPGVPIADVERQLVAVLADDGVRVTRSGDPGIQSPPPPLSARILAPVRQVAGELWPGVTIVPTMSTGATDGRFLNSAGIATYGLSGLFHDAEGAHAHGLDERIRVSSLLDGRRFLYEVVRRYSTDGSARGSAAH